MKLFSYLFFIFIINSNLYAQIAEDATKIDLHVSILPGESYLYSTSTKQNIIQEIMGEKVEINQEFVTDYKYLVESNDGKSIKIKATYDRLGISIDSPQDQINYSSDNETNDKQLSSLNNLIGKSFYIFMNTNGKVYKVVGFEELSKDLELDNSVEQIFTDSSLISSLNMDIYANNPVGMGESWNKTNSINLTNLKLKNSLTYTLEGSSEDLAWLNVNGEVSNIGDNERFEISLKGTQQGTIEADLKSGMISSGTTRMEIDAIIKSLDIQIPLKFISETITSSRKL